jgi:ribosome maturation factor RimP
MNQFKTRDDVIAGAEQVLAEVFPDVEIVDVEIRGGREAVATLFIDRPGGVDLELCAAVTQALEELRERYALEVSSPGLDRPLRTVAHFDHALGQRVYVKTREPIDGRAVYRGVLTAADSEALTLRLDEGDVVEIPLAAVAKAHVIYDFDHNGQWRAT